MRTADMQNDATPPDLYQSGGVLCVLPLVLVYSPCNPHSRTCYGDSAGRYTATRVPSPFSLLTVIAPSI